MHWIEKHPLATPLALCLAVVGLSQPATASDWPMFGQNFANTADSHAEQAISAKNVARLKPKWVAATGGVYAGSMAADAGQPNMLGIDAATGKILAVSFRRIGHLRRRHRRWGSLLGIGLREFRPTL